MDSARSTANDDDAAQRPILAMRAAQSIAFEIEHTTAPVFDGANAALRSALAGRPALLVVDERLWPAHGRAITRYADAHLHCAGIVQLAGDETTKSFEAVTALCATAIERALPRNGAFVAVGGGTILDAVGFAASIYRRGVAYVRVPTTLVGMIDVGVGIKQAVNFGGKKNVIGSFYPPLRTLNDITFLAGLPRRELACGIAEAIKIAVLCDRTLFALIEDHAGELVDSGFVSPRSAGTALLVRAEAAMIAQLAPNLYETSLCRTVDFGHSFSPLIETSTGYAVAHGEAVALDMLISTAIAVARTLCPPNVVDRLATLYRRIGLPVAHPALSPLLLERALSDARLHRGGALNLVVPTGIGSADFLQAVSYSELVAALHAIAALPPA